MPFFFTVGTLLGFFGSFGPPDAFLEFLLKGFLEEFSSFVKKKGFQEVESLSSFVIVISDEVAFVQ